MKRIFVVEDEPGIAFGLKVDFEAEGYEVETEADGQAALERARGEKFDLILLDVTLPRKDGFEICRELRRDGSKVPIVLLTARAQEAAAPVFRFGDAEVDLDRCELRRHGVPVELTALEFKLLAAFAANCGRTLSRDRLLDLVWGRRAAVTLRVVDNHVVELRKKVEPEPSNPRFLRSIRGLGYRFDA